MANLRACATLVVAILSPIVIVGTNGASAQQAENPAEPNRAEQAPAEHLPAEHLPADDGSLELGIPEETPSEPDYAEVAKDARLIAEEIGKRLIETDMEDATAFLNEADGRAGHLKAEQAYSDMEQMIKFCEATAGKGGKACQFKLQIKMSLNPGNTLGQLSKSMGSGQGFSGLTGQGNAGMAGSQTRFGMFGPESMGQPSRQSDRLGNRRVDSQTRPDAESDPLAGNVDELASGKREDAPFSAEGGVRIIEEYRPLIEAYFKRVTEEDSQP